MLRQQADIADLAVRTAAEGLGHHVLQMPSREDCTVIDDLVMEVSSPRTRRALQEYYSSPQMLSNVSHLPWAAPRDASGHVQQGRVEGAAGRQVAGVQRCTGHFWSLAPCCVRCSVNMECEVRRGLSLMVNIGRQQRRTATWPQLGSLAGFRVLTGHAASCWVASGLGHHLHVTVSPAHGSQRTGASLTAKLTSCCFIRRGPPNAVTKVSAGHDSQHARASQLLCQSHPPVHLRICWPLHAAHSLQPAGAASLPKAPPVHFSTYCCLCTVQWQASMVAACKCACR